MQHWARRLEQEIDGVMRIFGGAQQLREVSLSRGPFWGTLLHMGLGGGFLRSGGASTVWRAWLSTGW